MLTRVKQSIAIYNPASLKSSYFYSTLSFAYKYINYTITILTYTVFGDVRNLPLNEPLNLAKPLKPLA